MDLKMLRRLVRLMTGADITELEIDDAPNGVRVRLKRGSATGESVVQPMVQVLPGAAAPVAPSAASAAVAGGEATGGSGIPAGHEQITSPMVGTFYRAASPEADPFVDVGGSVDDESVVCIIEAMKVMNEIKAELRGVVAEVLVENGEPIEFGQPLFLVKTS
ncbi:MAG: acetyl-CoA carboxylase, biotin carboxyl carrier protein [Planctomycetes bacterium]|nr:acetyl-CoA carboxylase, biotin carboxyl carrier protein [Planctomycetota bacterium]